MTTLKQPTEAAEQDSNAPAPVCGVTASGALRFVWSGREQFLDLEVLPDGSVDWFFEDDRTGERDGTMEDGDPFVASAFVARLRSLRP